MAQQDWFSQFAPATTPKKTDWFDQFGTDTTAPGIQQDTTYQEPAPKKGYLDIAGDFLQAHPTLRRFFAGAQPEDIEQYKKDIPGFKGDIQGPGIMRVPGLSKLTDYAAEKVAGSGGSTGGIDARLLLGAGVKGIGDFLEGGFDPRMVAPKTIPRVDVPRIKAEGAVANYARPGIPGRLELPPAPPEAITNASRVRGTVSPEGTSRVHYGQEPGAGGVTSTDIPYKLDLSDPTKLADAIQLNKLDPAAGPAIPQKFQGQGIATLNPMEAEGAVNQIPADLAANLAAQNPAARNMPSAQVGLGVGNVPKFDIGSLQGVLGDLEALKTGQARDVTDILPKSKPKRTQISSGLPGVKWGTEEQISKAVPSKSAVLPPRDYTIGDPRLPYQVETAQRLPKVEVPKVEVKPTKAVPVSKAQITPTAGPGLAAGVTIPGQAAGAAAKVSEQISPKAGGFVQRLKDRAALTGYPKEVKDAIAKWAYGQQGAKVKSNVLAEQFKDLIDPKLVDQYEAGIRTGRLADVEKVLKERLAQGRTAGIFKEGQEVPNYLRHEFEQDPEAVSAALKTAISKDPSIAKTRRFPSYAAAEAQGLKRKYQTIPEILGAYESKFHKAVKNKELYDWAIKTGRLPEGTVIKDPEKWTKFQGKDAEQTATLLKNAIGNITGKGSPEVLKKAANISSFTKNLYLGSGIPKTPLNMHMYNITRSDVMARGVKHGIGDFFSGVFKPSKDVADITKHANSGLLGELVDHGLGWTNIEDHAALFARENKSKFKSAVDKATDMQQKVFEDPLFKIHLPAVKLRFANGRVSELLEKGLSRSDALTQAAREANDFYGGINKVLRNKTYSDLSRIGLLAPDWLESRANLAGKGAASLFGKADPIYAKALARGAGMRVAGGAATAGLTGYVMNKSKRATNATDIPIGRTQSGLNRNLPMYGSAVEGLKIPEEVLSGRDLGNVITSRISMPARSIYHIIANEDVFGNPLRGKDKYDRPISKKKAAWNMTKEVGNVVQPPWLVALEQVLSGKDPEAAIGQGLELPIEYNREPPNKKLLQIRLK